jgi:hypothetical protein
LLLLLPNPHPLEFADDAIGILPRDTHKGVYLCPGRTTAPKRNWCLQAPPVQWRGGQLDLKSRVMRSAAATALLILVYRQGDHH